MKFRMKTLKVTALVLAAMTAFLTSSQAVVINGFGKETCGDLAEIVKDSPSGADAALLSAWSMGYLIGVSRHSNHVGGLNVANVNDVGRWLGEYCAVHAESRLIDALDVFIDEHPR